MDAWIHGLLKAVGSSIVALPWVPVETRPCLVDHAGFESTMPSQVIVAPQSNMP